MYVLGVPKGKHGILVAVKLMDVLINGFHQVFFSFKRHQYKNEYLKNKIYHLYKLIIPCSGAIAVDLGCGSSVYLSGAFRRISAGKKHFAVNVF